MNYRPSEPFTTTLELLQPTYTTIKGVTKKEYTVLDTINCSFKTFGGTEKTVNDVIVTEDTATIETWYRDDITAACQLRHGTKLYEIMGEPEDISGRHMYLKFKIRAVKGGA